MPGDLNRIRRIEAVDWDMAAIFGRMTEARRLQIGCGMWRSARDMIRNLLRAEHPDWNEAQVGCETARRLSHGAVSAEAVAPESCTGSSPTEVMDLLRRLADVLEEIGLPYLVTGSMATIAYGEPRFTNDIDVVVDLPLDVVDRFCEAFPDEDFYLSRPAVREAVLRQRQFEILHPRSGLKVDVMIASRSAFDESRLSRGRRLPVILGRTVAFASPEDVILKKLEYFREGGSEKHIRDISGVLRALGDGIDVAFLETWAARLGVSKEWQEAAYRRLQ